MSILGNGRIALFNLRVKGHGKREMLQHARVYYNLRSCVLFSPVLILGCFGTWWQRLSFFLKHSKLCQNVYEGQRYCIARMSFR